MVKSVRCGIVRDRLGDRSEVHTRLHELWPTVGTIVALIASFVFLEYAVRSLPVGTAYAIWVGIGAVGTAALGTVLLGESREPLRLLCLALIVAGVVGLKLVTPAT
jgi:quaternary ammonium compound-resistance protein SugE